MSNKTHLTHLVFFIDIFYIVSSERDFKPSSGQTCADCQDFCTPPLAGVDIEPLS